LGFHSWFYLELCSTSVCVFYPLSAPRPIQYFKHTMGANPKDTVGINLLVFNGKKDKFRVWTTKFVSHLKEMTVVLQGQWLASITPHRPESTINSRTGCKANH
ncbi:hypothetical protein B5M09_011696, partial [Aphanomyces astaci]